MTKLTLVSRRCHDVLMNQMHSVNHCVVFRVCSVEATTEPPTPSCPANEVHDTCGTACPETCNGRPFVCTLQCVIGCRCASGFVRHEGACIERESCPGQ